jgi:NifU-like protein
VDKESETIADAKFQTFGCGSAIASSSILTEMIKGKTIEEALKVTNKDIAEALGGLPPEKMHCSVMGREALDAAVANYRGLSVAHEEADEGRLVCSCFGITEGKIRRVAEENQLRSAEDVTNYTKAGGACGSCLDDINDILEDLWGEAKGGKKEEAKPKKKLTNLERIVLIKDILDNEVRPMLQRDGGDLELIDIDGADVIVRMVGHCSGCRAAGFTTGWIAEKMQEIIDPDIKVRVTEES